MRLLLLILLANCSPVSSLGWAGWSPWAPCSKSCGGGVSQQLRRCLDERCSGHSARYRVCNVLDCEKPSRSTRDTICSGEIILSKQQCEVVCKSRSTGTQFLWRVADGTPCQAASTRAVCSQGSCQVVGCDDIIGSSLRFDACGVCGGRGDTCDSAQFVWKESGEFTPCAGSCDDAQHATRESRSVSVCINAHTGRVVPERLCADRLRPKPKIRLCPPLICPSSWLASDWTECQPPCGGGIRTRSVYCVHKTAAHSVNVPDTFCLNQTKPVSEETCGDQVCGRWQAGRWSRCTASCGQGIRTRSVECVGGTDCGQSHRPASEDVCYAGVPCPIAEAQALTMSNDDQNVDWGERRLLDGSSYSPMDGGGHSPRVVPGPWSDCSATCGPGVQSRVADCIALHPITAHVIKLPFIECQSLSQPTLFQPCELKACPLQEDAKVSPVDSAPFRWEYGEWTPCSASCLGGKAMAQLKCVEAATGRAVAWSQCDHRTRLPEKSKNCNQQACPPLWQVGAYDACTASCGGGVSTRAVKCVRPVSRSGGADAHIVLPDSQCPSPKPPHTQTCGAVACPATWITGEWTECSTSCGSGEQRRRVTCEGKDARGRRDRRSEKECAGDKPITVQMCSLGSCEKPQLLSNRVFEQTASEKKLTIGIGGFATVYHGTSIKVKCPTKGFNKKKVWWAKNGRKIKNDAHIKVSTNGHLRIFHARLEDAGVYECFADNLVGNVTLIFKYRDDERAAHRLDPSQMMRPEPTKPIGQPNISFIEGLLNANTDKDVALELKKYGDLIKAEWNIGHWSDCKQVICGVSGYQARGISCHVVIEGTRRRGDDSICAALAGSKPTETRPCHREDCPRWEASDWTECSVSKCIRDGLAQQKREVTCVFNNGTTTDEMRCDRTNQPKSRKECETQLCKAEWRASDWGSCSSTCGTGGVQLRLLSCVWAATGKAAGRSCEGARRPSAARACPIHNLPPCRPEALALMQDASCEDQSRFCDIIKLFHTCDSNEVRQKCCATCRYMEQTRV